MVGCALMDVAREIAVSAAKRLPLNATTKEQPTILF
jgi:hypothetical protein